jgi:hypothetical protein
MSQITHIVRHASGCTTEHSDYQEAIAAVYGAYPDAYTHDCDDGRTLVWPSEEDSEGDDGSSAVAEIREVDA